MSVQADTGLEGGAESVTGHDHAFDRFQQFGEDMENRISVLLLGEEVKVRIGEKTYVATYQKAVLWRN